MTAGQGQSEAGEVAALPAEAPGGQPQRRLGELPGAIPTIEAWQRERTRLERRARLPDWIFAYLDALGDASDSLAVDRAMAEYVPAIVGAFCAVVFRQRNRRRPDAPFEAQPTGHQFDLPDLPADTVMRHARPMVVTRNSVGEKTGPREWIPLLDSFGAAQLACSPLGDDGLIILAERRTDRVLTSEDWDLFQSVVRLAERSLGGAAPGSAARH